ncbi:MAG: hemH [Cytophagaceae bacterium]|jgi:ferrochelatase|nr:hemH [Cytophagaceae bacterium]
MVSHKKSHKTGVLLINLGTPDSPATPDVRKYLREFLMDRRVIDIPVYKRWPLINLIIAPFRAHKSAKVYNNVWMEEGSPLLVYSKRAKDLLAKSLGEEYEVELAMRYQSPSIERVVNKWQRAGLAKLIVIPLFPQYASASTGSATEELLRVIQQWEVIPELKVVENFCDDPLFIRAFAELGKKYMQEHAFDHFVFSYHGLPERQILKASVDNYCKLGDCCSVYHSKNKYCYRAQCYETTRLLVEQLGLTKEQYTVCFQSRLGKTPWIKPYADEVIPDLAKKGKKKILFFSPSFVADCLETIEEGGQEYKELFEHSGGEHWQLVESLNTSETWIECLKSLVEEGR